MAGNKTNNSKKKKGNFLPILVVVIVGFLAYQANPSYWQQGKLFEDFRKKLIQHQKLIPMPVLTEA